MTKDLKQFLTKLELSLKEADVYLTGLKNGPMHASEIAKECGLTRPNAYDVLKTLQTKGLVTQLGSAYAKKFKMATASELQMLITRKRKEQEEIEHELHTLLPSFKDIQGRFYEPYPKIEFFEGIEGIKQLVEKSLQTEEKIIKTATSIKSWIELLGKEFTNYYIDKRISKKIYSLTLRLKDSDINEPLYQQHKKQKRQVRYTPTGIELVSTVMLFDDKVAIINTKKENLGLLVHSPNFSHTMQSWFDFIWNLSK